MFEESIEDITSDNCLYLAITFTPWPKISSQYGFVSIKRVFNLALLIISNFSPPLEDPTLLNFMNVMISIIHKSKLMEAGQTSPLGLLQIMR